MAVPVNITILSINQTAIIMDVNKYSCDKDDSTLFQIIDEAQVFEYPHCTGVGYSNFSLLPMDTVLYKVQFYVKQGTHDELITLKNISFNIAAVRQNEVEEFNLESFSINTSDFLPNCDNVQEIQFTQVRDFILPSEDCHSEIKIFRMPTLDIAGYSAYEFIYPFKVRWEEWRNLIGASRCFPTPTQNWMIYGNEAGWSIKIALKASVEDQSTNHTTYFEHIMWGTIKDPCADPYSVEFNTYDSTGVSSFEEVVAQDVDTLVEAIATGDFNGLSESDLYGILTLDAWGVGGVAYSQEIGTRTDVDEDFVWYGASSTLRATLTKINNSTVKISAYINYLYLPEDTDQFILSAKVRRYIEALSSSGATCLNELITYYFVCGQFNILDVVDDDTLIVSGQVVTQEQRDIFVDNLVIKYLTSTTWEVLGGEIDGNTIFSGTVGGNIIKAPSHPYTDANVGDTLQGDITGTLNSSEIPINGIGDMQIGCTFFVS